MTDLVLADGRSLDLRVAGPDDGPALVLGDPGLVTVPALARAVAALLDQERADYLEKS